MKQTASAPKTERKYELLADSLRRDILAAVLKPGDRLPSILEMRRTRGASQATAQRAHQLLEQEGLVVREANRGVFVAGPTVRTKRGVVGVSLPLKQLQHSYYTTLLSGIQRFAHESEVELLLVHQSSTIRWEKVDGMILTTPSRAAAQSLPAGMPAVSLLHPLPVTASVITDDFDAVRQLTGHLLELGHERIAFLTGAVRPFANEEGDFYADTTSNNRLKGYYHALRSAGMEPEESWVRPLLPKGHMLLQDDRVLGRESMKRWLAQGWERLSCTALMAQNDGIAIGCIDMLQGAGYRVPEDVSVVGFNGLEIGDYFSPSLTTVKVPLEEIGALGARILLEEVDKPVSSVADAAGGGQNPVHRQLASTLKIGASSSVPGQKSAPK